MQVVKLLQMRSRASLPSVHQRRLRSVWAAVSGLLTGRKLWLSALGRHLPSETSEKHAIKRVDRLLGNIHLRSERSLWYRWISEVVLKEVETPVVLVDWSRLDSGGKLHLLRAAVAVGGRALPVYERVHHKCNDPKIERAFLDELERQLGPGGRTPILVSDAGFGVDWFEHIQSKGWYYVGRVLKNVSVKVGPSGSWMRHSRLFEQAGAKAKALGPSDIRQSQPFATNLYLYKQVSQGRVRKTRTGHRDRSARSQKSQWRESRPWLLASNLPSAQAKRVVRVYRTRMQIEEGFRDLKSPRYGFSLRENLGTDRERVANLLLVAALAVLATWLMGMHGKHSGYARTLQANTERRRVVLSTFFIGLRMLAKQLSIEAHQLEQALARLRADAASQAYVLSG